MIGQDFELVLDRPGFFIIEEAGERWGYVATKCLPCSRTKIDEATQPMGLVVDGLQDVSKAKELLEFTFNLHPSSEYDEEWDPFEGIDHTHQKLGAAY